MYSRMPLSGPSAAFLNAALISSFVVFFSKTQVRSTMETSGTGTRKAIPSIRPVSSGNTSVAALAAPVDVGIMFIAPARARRRSE